MADFRKLFVWQKARILIRFTYQVTSTFPSYEAFGLAGQMQRAAVSIASNIAEGCGRDSGKDFSRFLKMAKGSLYELETQYYVAFDLQYINDQTMIQAEQSCEEIGKMLTGILRKLNTTSH